MGVGFVAGIHVIPMVLLLNTAFPLDGGPAPEAWAAALLLGAQSMPAHPVFQRRHHALAADWVVPAGDSDPDATWDSVSSHRLSRRCSILVF